MESPGRIHPMWSCAPCGAANEPHAIFCNVCGAARFKGPIREAAGPIEPAPLPAPELPGFQGTATGFALVWTLATLGGAFGAWLVQSCVSFAMNFSGMNSWGIAVYRIASGIAFGFIHGGLVGASQAWVLSSRVPRPG